MSITELLKEEPNVPSTSELSSEFEDRQWMMGVVYESGHDEDGNKLFDFFNRL